jgi:septin family protein
VATSSKGLGFKATKASHFTNKIEMSTRRIKNIPAFNLLVAGHSRTGKSDFLATLYDTLDIQKLIPEGGLETVPEKIFRTNFNSPTPLSCKIECKLDSSRLLLQLIDSPGLEIHPAFMQAEGAMEKAAHDYLASLLKFIEAQFAKTLYDEAKVKRTKTPDYQIHCCLYFLSPEQVLLNKGLSQADRIVLAGLTMKCNVIPCLGKSVRYYT